jgi:hypothetical protein
MLAAPGAARTPAAPPTPTAPVVPTIYSGTEPPIGLTGGAGSLDELVERMLAAVTAGDLPALHRLRLTKEEYCNIIVPGEVPKGQLPRQTFEKVNDVFFGMLDTRSRYAAEAIVQSFKGKKFVDRRITLTKPTREFAWYTAHGEVRVSLREESGAEGTLRTGWVAEVDGRYKFIGFNWDD